MHSAPDWEMTEMPPGSRHVAGERGVHLVVRVDEAQAVGAHQAGARGAAEIGDLLLEARALLAHFLEAGGDHHDGLGALARSEEITAPLTAAVGTAMTLRSICLPYSSRLV